MSDELTPRAYTAVLAALDADDPAAYFKRVAELDPPTFCELLGHVLASEVHGSPDLAELIAAVQDRKRRK